jgi:DNA polymerase-1
MTITSLVAPPKELVTEKNFYYALMCLQANNEAGIDTETTGIDHIKDGRDYLTGICVSVEGFDGYFPFRHTEGNLPREYLYKLLAVLEHMDLVWHNQKFDFHSFKTIGVDPLTAFKGQQYDTLMLAHLVNEELYSKELDALAKWYLKDSKHPDEAKIHKMGQLYGYADVTPTIMAPYGAKDANLTRRLKQLLWAEVCKQELTDVYLSTEAPFTKLLYKLEQRGVGVNKDICEEYAVRGRRRMASIVRTVGFSPSSPKQLGNYLLKELGLPVFAHTKSCEQCTKYKRPVGTHEGPPSFNKKAMEEYDDILQEHNNPTARLVGEFRGWQKAVTSLYEPLLEKTGPDGLIRTNFKQHGTVTRRLSASDPNLQQVPRGSDKPWNGKAKSAFHSGRPGYKLIGWDYAQLELRLGASYGREQVLLTEFEREGADPFSILAEIIFSILTPETRHDTKTFVYANLFGAGLLKIAAQLGRPVEEVEELYENYKNGIPGIMSTSRMVNNAMKSRGYIKYWDGARRHMKDKNDSYKAWNSLLQGGGAQLVKKAMLRCEEFEDDNCMMVLQVHDEITFIIKEDMIPHYEPMIIKAMTDWDLGVRMAVEGKEWK